MADSVTVELLQAEANKPRSLYNPMNITFVFSWDKIEYRVPSKQAVTLPNYLARHGAEHLAKYIFNHNGRLEDTLLPDGKIKPNSMSRQDLEAYMDTELLDQAGVVDAGVSVDGVMPDELPEGVSLMDEPVAPKAKVSKKKAVKVIEETPEEEVVEVPTPSEDNV